MSELRTKHDIADQRSGLVAVFFQRSHQALNRALISALQAPAKCVAQDLTDDVAQELLFTGEQQLPQLDRSVEFFTGGQSAGRIDRLSIRLGIPPTSHPIEVFEAQSDRVH